MRNLIAFSMIVVAVSAVPAQAQQIPAVPPTQWSISIRSYGTTDQPGHDALQITVHANGKLPASILAKRPVYDENGKISLTSPVHLEKLDEKACLAIYSAARSVILNQRIGEQPRAAIQDGDSLEITIASFDRKISATFDHSGSENSKDVQAMLKAFSAQLPKKNFGPR